MIGDELYLRHIQDAQISTNLALRLMDEGHFIFGVDRTINTWTNRFQYLILLMLTAIALAACDGGSPQDFMSSGIDAYHHGNYNQALAALDQAAQMVEPHPQAHYYKGLCYYSMGDYSKAIEEFQSSFQESPPILTVVYSARGAARYKHGDYQKAIEDFDAALYGQPNLTFALLYRGEIYSKQNETQKALDDLNKVIKLAPNNAEAYFYRAAVYNAMGKSQEALQDTKKADEIMGDPSYDAKAENQLLEFP
jgi:tetratricopeptide (TPR) repeat protein